MKKFIIFIILYSSINGQGWGGREIPEIGLLKGTVVDSLTNTPIEYASLSLISNPSGEIITGGVTDADGQFYIDKIKLGNYKVIVEFIGYQKKIINPVKLTFQDKFDKNLGIIKLNASSLEMEAVNVIEDKPVYEFKTDKLVYNSSDDIVSGSGTAEDVLRKVPMVTVDQDGQIQLRGNSGVRVLVNGRPNRMGGDVDNIPASLIDKVEVITAPSAKYDPEGIAGIINIVLKKGEYEGLNGSIKFNGKHNQYNSINAVNGFTFYSNYQTEKFNAYGSYSLNNRARYVDGNRIIDREYSTNDDDTLLTNNNFINSFSDFKFNNQSERSGYGFKLGNDYYINKNFIINTELNFKNYTRDSEKNQNIISQIGGIEAPKDTINFINKEIENPNNYYIGSILEIKKEYDIPDKQFLFSLEFDKEDDSETAISALKADSTTISENSNGINIRFGYDLPLKNENKFSLGYDGKLNNNSEEMKFELTNDDESRFVGEVDFGYKRNIHGFFMEYDYKINDKLSIKPSMRVEYLDKNISFSKNVIEDSSPESMVYAQVLYNQQDTTYQDSYSTIYPNLNLLYKINKKQNIQFSVSRRVKRPDEGWGGPGNQIRPFPRDVYSRNFIFLGDPLLRPEYSTQYEVSYKGPIPMGFMTSSIFYHNITDMIKWYDNDQYAGSDVVTFRNSESGENYGADFFFLLMGQVIGGGYNVNTAFNPDDDYELNGKNERFNMYMRVTLPEQYIKLFNFEFGFYAMKMNVPGGSLFGKTGTVWANSGISKSFLENRLDLSLSVDNIFDQGGFQMDRYKEYNPVGFNNVNASENAIVETYRGGRTYAFNIKFNFGKMQEDKMKMRRGRSRGGDGGMMEMY